MSFGSGFGSGGGFGANKNNNTGFGFGSNNTGSGFGQQNNTSGFGSTTTNTGGSGFGSTPSIFGSGSGFGSTPSFGGTTANNSSTGGSLFGNTANNNTSSGFGGFGANNNNNTSNSTTGLFGNANRTGFGNNSGTGMFGNTGNTTSSSAFGSNNTNSLFGSTPASTALGGNVPESQGTASPPFQAYTEKDTPTGNATNHFQTITFMQPYQKYSLEELRLADYNQGRRFATSTGQAGGFGATSFGGFGNNNASTTSTGLFGQQSQAPAFGTNSSTTSNTFGGGSNNTGTGFGLFGNTNNQQSGGAFGTTNNTTGFGNQQQGNAFGGTTSGGLFGNAQTSKPPSLTFGTGTSNNASGGLFGNTNQGTSTGFGTQNNTSSGGLFGNLGSQNNAFGTTTSNASNPTSFGTNTSNNTTSGLFGNLGQNNQQATGGLFGNNNATSGGSLFGNKPATNTGSTAFGNSNPTASGGLFGNLSNNSNPNQNQQNQGGGLFGANTNTGTTGGLFGNLGNNNAAPNNNNNQSTSLFGNLGQTQNQGQNQSGGLFGNQSTNANNNPMNNSLLNSSQQSNALQPPQAYIASMLDRTPYGSASIFNGLPPPPQTGPGPIATPIAIGSALKKPTPLPQNRLNSSMGSRYLTPQKQGYGFSYSTYGTPSSVSSIASTPGAYGNSLLGSSFGRNLGKSYSMGNLRRTYDGETESILSPGAFSSTNTRHSGGGGLKRLTIDRSLRTDLFGNQALAALPSSQAPAQPNQAPSLKKKVSFGSTTLNDNGSISGPAGGSEQNSGTAGSSTEDLDKQKNSNNPSASSSAALDPQTNGPTTRNNGRSNNTRTNGLANGIQTQNAKGNELAVVHEDESPTPTGPSSSSTKKPPPKGTDPLPGGYYMIPSRDELRTYTRAQLKQVSGYILGRENCGFVSFDKPVDLTTLDIDHIFPNLAQMDIRSLTIYPDTPNKPAPGQGLNVPATIHLPNSWPRLRDKVTACLEMSGPRFEKHVSRLKGIAGTEFVRYEKETGTWVFKVPHFSRYGLDYDDFDDEDDLGQSQLSAFTDSPTPKSRTPKGRDTPAPPSGLLQSSTLSERLADESSGYDSSLEDTFEYRKRSLFPGAFDQSHLTHGDEHQMEEMQHDEMPFLEQRPAVASPHHIDGREPSNVDGINEVEENLELSYEEEDSMDVVGAFPQQDSEEVFFDQSVYRSRSILKTTQQSTPVKPFDIAEGWAQQLQRTVSPQKRDRLVLRESTANRLDVMGALPQESPSKRQRKADDKEITTSIDLMKSLFGQEEARRSGQGKKEQQLAQQQGFQWPYSRDSEAQSSRQLAREQHQTSRKPLSFGSIGRLICEKTNAPLRPSNRSTNRRSTRFVKDKGIQLVPIRKRSTELITPNLVYQRSCTGVYLENCFPYASAKAIPFRSLEKGIPDGAAQEGLIWKLASILFDDDDDDVSRGVPTFHKTKFEDRIRKDRLSEFWEGLCQEQATRAVAIASSAELRALAHLSMHNIEDACKVLLEGKDFRLATLVAQIGSDATMQEDIRAQITEWGSLKVLSEMTEPIRALYDLLAGNAFMCTGQSGHVEDRALPFPMSEKFGLDWKRAFGLRLWYAKPVEKPIEASIKQFEEDLKDGESRVPVATSPNHGDLSNDAKTQASKQEDVLWQMMKLFANLKDSSTSASLRTIFSTSSQVDSRLAFQLLRGLSRAGFYTDPVDADRVVTDFAVELDNAGEWVWAIWVLLHLSNQEQRMDALKEVIYAHAAQIGEADSETYETLHKELHVPKAMLWRAKALYARAVEGDYVQEMSYLLRAKEFDEAHTRLVQVVGPQAVITQEHAMLQDLLDSFANKDWVKDWSLGGQVYEDYIRLVKGLSKEERGVVIKRLMNSLATMEKQRGDKMGFEEVVAIQEMSKVVGQAVLKEQNKASLGSKVLQLPTTENSYLNNTRELSLQYYKAVMAGGK